ncbi:MAG: helix-turn-helix domain-containing protein [Thermodesulfobacteriota bacterium]
MDQKAKKVLSAMKKAGKPMKPGEIAVAVGLESQEVSKIINELKKEGAVTSPKRCYWAPI